MLKNIAKGNYWEREFSIYTHQKYSALLISSKFLRKYNLGQIDLSFIDKGSIHLVEVKASSYGLENTSYKQLSRLKDSAKMISELFDVNVELHFVSSCQMKRASLSLK